MAISGYHYTFQMAKLKQWIYVLTSSGQSIINMYIIFTADKILEHTDASVHQAECALQSYDVMLPQYELMI